jgi:ADP-heptose:LPS heptosyltransferase
MSSSFNNKSDKKTLPDMHKIAVVRANALGDFIFTLPALEALRNAYPEAEIVLLAKDWHRTFLAKRPSPVDRVIVVPPYGGVSAEPGSEQNEDELERFFSQMQREHFDLAIQLHGGGGYSNPFVCRLQAKLAIGLKAPNAFALDRWVPYEYFQSEIMRYLEVVSLVGAVPTTVEPRIAVTKEDVAEAQRAVVEDAHPLVVLHPGATDTRRRWSACKFAQVGDALAARGARILVTGVKAEAAAVEEVRESMQAQAHNLCAKLTLNGLTGLFSRCHLVISNDTGPLHLAYALRTPSIGLYWAFNVMTAGEPMRTIHRPVTSWRMSCPVCGADNSCGHCGHQVSFINDIAVEEVLLQVKDMGVLA